MTRDRRTDALLTTSLLFAVFLWGGNNTGTKVVVGSWPPIWTGSSRFCCAGLLLLATLRWTNWLGNPSAINAQLNRLLWFRGGLSLGAYIVAFNSAVRFTAASHVAVYLGAAPVWALLWEAPSCRKPQTWMRYLAAAVALGGVCVLFAPSIRNSRTDWIGECLGLASSVLWTNYGIQCRAFSAQLNGAEVSAHTMLRAGLLLLPLGVIEVITRHGIPLTSRVIGIQLYCIAFGGVAAFAIWNQALRHWSASRVLLFNNLIPLSTTLWAAWWLHETITPTFWLAMGLVLLGVAFGQIQAQAQRNEPVAVRE